MLDHVTEDRPARECLLSKLLRGLGDQTMKKLKTTKILAMRTLTLECLRHSGI